jgi:membrane-associated phospholipid phosphatase
MGLPERPTPCRREPFVAWPGWGLLGHALLLALAQTLWWVLVYHGGDWLTGLRAHRVRVHLEAELAMPFVPPLILVYVTIGLVFFPAPFVLRSRRELRALALTLAVVTAVAAVGYLLLPAEPAYPPQDHGAWSGLFAVGRRLALRYNMVPSLHVAMSCVCLAAYAARCGPAGKAALGAWGAAIALSTLLTHQHHLLDVATGMLLAAVARRFVYERWAGRGCPA